MADDVKQMQMVVTWHEPLAAARAGELVDSVMTDAGLSQIEPWIVDKLVGDSSRFWRACALIAICRRRKEIRRQ